MKFYYEYGCNEFKGTLIKAESFHNQTTIFRTYVNLTSYKTTFPINPFYATGLFLYPPKTENQGISNVFREYRKRLVACDKLISSEVEMVFNVHIRVLRLV